jgi:hypothetical protein
VCLHAARTRLGFGRHGRVSVPLVVAGGQQQPFSKSLVESLQQWMFGALHGAHPAAECFRLEILECRRSLGEDVIGQTGFADSSRHCNGPDQCAEY